MGMERREIVFEHDDDAVEHRKLNWRAIIAGTVATIGIQVWFLYLGGALGLSSFNADRAATFSDYAILGPIAFLAFTALVSSFAGAWICGHWANLNSDEDAYMHGGLTWALSAIVIAMGLGTALGLSSSAVQSGANKAMASAAASGQEAGAQQSGSLAYDRLNDKKFADFVSQRAKSHMKSADGKPIDVSYEAGDERADNKSRLVEADNIADDYQLTRFVMNETRMSEDEAEKFLEANKEPIAQAAANSQREWELAHSRDLAKAEAARRSASEFAWTMALLGLLSLGMALAGSYLGWKHRYNDDLGDDDDKILADTGRPDAL
jgi:hypothetical protein